MLFIVSRKSKADVEENYRRQNDLLEGDDNKYIGNR